MLDVKRREFITLLGGVRANGGPKQSECLIVINSPGRIGI